MEQFVAHLECAALRQQGGGALRQLRAELERAVKPCGPHDMQIRGHARSEGLILVTNTMREFARMRRGCGRRTGSE
jgi:tRNA(fMet)-specific endonuclease VapC